MSATTDATTSAATCVACGGPMHNPTWGCVRPRPAEPVVLAPTRQARGVTVGMWTSPVNGAVTVQIDTEPGARVNVDLNDARLFEGDPETDSPTLATLETGRFRFDVLGETRADAQRLLEAAWRTHCREYPAADPELYHHLVADGGAVRFVPLVPGTALRDGERLHT